MRLQHSMVFLWGGSLLLVLLLCHTPEPTQGCGSSEEENQPAKAADDDPSKSSKQSDDPDPDKAGDDNDDGNDDDEKNSDKQEPCKDEDKAANGFCDCVHDPSGSARHGGNMDDEGSDAEDWDQCVALCYETEGCIGVNFWKEMKKCYLKTEEVSADERGGTEYRSCLMTNHDDDEKQ